MSASNYLELKLLDHTLNNTSFTSPATVYLALFTSNPTDAGTGTEVSGGSYARQSMSFASAASGSIATDADISFSSMPTATVTHWGIYDASSGGNLLVYGAFDETESVSSGDTFTVSSGDLTVSLD